MLSCKDCIGQNERVVLPGVVFSLAAKGREFLVVSLGEGFSGGGGGVVFLWRMREKGKGVGRVTGWGGDRQRHRQVDAHAFVKTTL